MAWHLKKTDTGELFSDRSFEELLCWAHSAKINPRDEVSDDGKNWKLAKDIPQFEMHWTVMLKDGEHYGPTNISTLREFLSADLLHEDSLALHINGTTVEIVKNLIKKSEPQSSTTQQQQPVSQKNPENTPSSNWFGKAVKPVTPPQQTLRRSGPKVRDYHTQPLPIPAHTRVPPPKGVIFPKEVESLPRTDTDPE